MRFTPFVHTRQWLVVRAMALSGIILLFMVPVGNLTWAPLAHAQTNSVVDHRIIIGAYGSQGYCYDWQDSGEGYGPGCWHQDEGSQWDAIDVSGPGIGEGTNVYHQEYGVQGSVALWVTAINRCGQYDTGTNCNGGTGCSYVYVQMRDINTGAPIGEEHYLHIVPQASLGYVGQANYGWTSFAIGYLAANQPNSCSFKGAHLHQSGSKVYPSQVTNHNIGAGAGDPPSGCGGAIPQFLCISPFGDTDYHWLHAIEEGTPAAPAYWMTLPGGVLDAAIGKEGSTWVLGTASAGNGYQVFHVNGSG